MKGFYASMLLAISKCVGIFMDINAESMENSQPYRKPTGLCFICPRSDMSDDEGDGICP